jgi:hypothetical protein
MNEAGPSFDSLNEHFSIQSCRQMVWLTLLAMRDFFILTGAVLILAAFAPLALIAFALASAG